MKSKKYKMPRTMHGRLYCPKPNAQSQRRAAQRPCDRQIVKKVPPESFETRKIDLSLPCQKHQEKWQEKQRNPGCSTACSRSFRSHQTQLCVLTRESVKARTKAVAVCSGFCIFAGKEIENGKKISSVRLGDETVASGQGEFCRLGGLLVCFVG